MVRAENLGFDWKPVPIVDLGMRPFAFRIPFVYSVSSFPSTSFS